MTDCLVIGSGITGLACADALAQRGVRVTLVDQADAPGSAASGVPSALLAPPSGRLATKPLGQLAHASYAQYADWCAGLHAATGRDPGFAPVGSLRLYAQRPRKLHANQIWIDATEVVEQEPAIAPAACAGAVWSPQAARIDPPVLLTALDQRAHNHGMQRVTGAVTALLVRGDRVQGVQLRDGTSLWADQIVLAAGLGTVPLLADLGIALPLTADAGQIIQIADVPIPHHILLVGDYALVGREATVWVSGIHREPTDDPAAVRDATAQLHTAVHDVLAWTDRRGRVQRVWEGIRPRAPGGIPSLGPVPDWHNLIIATGHGSNGMLLAPLTADAVVAQVTAQPPPIAPCTPVSRGTPYTVD